MLDLGQIIEAVEGNAIPYSVLQERNGKKICRVEVHDNKTVILKLWRRVSLKGRIRALFNAQDMHREARALRLLAKACVNVPRVILQSSQQSESWTQSLLTEDLGDLPHAVDAIKHCIEINDQHMLRIIEDNLLSLTKALLANNIVDVDHKMVNILIANDGKVYRIDLELARQFTGQQPHPWRHGEMIGGLIIGYIYADQPDTKLAELFAKRLSAELELPVLARFFAKRYIAKALNKQHSEVGLRTNFSEDW